MNPMDMAIALSGGNPGALNVLLQSANRHVGIDPDDFAGSFGLMLHLDSMQLYNERIWMFYKDLCSQHLGKMTAVARANQLGILSLKVVNMGIDEPWIFDWSFLHELEERLPNFCLEK